VNAVRRRVACFLTAGAALALAACAASEPSQAARPRAYTETISSVLVSEDGQRIAAIGSNHHYIFEAPQVLVKALRSPVHPQLTATFAAFHLDPHNTLTGDWLLTLAPGAAPAQQQQAQEVGLARGADGTWSASGRLKGQRFTGWTYKLRGPQDKLNQAYEVEITTEASPGDVAVDEAATPIRVAADGVQLIYWAPLAPVIVPILFLTRAKDH